MWFGEETERKIEIYSPYRDFRVNDELVLFMSCFKDRFYVPNAFYGGLWGIYAVNPPDNRIFAIASNEADGMTLGQFKRYINAYLHDFESYAHFDLDYLGRAANDVLPLWDSRKRSRIDYWLEEREARKNAAQIG